MFQLQDLLKEGHRHLSGEYEVLYGNIDAVKQLAQVTRTSLGPNGMKKMVINHLEKLFVTSDAGAILKELEVIHPAAKLCVFASQMQEQEIGDGTNLVLILCGELLQNAETLLQKGLHPSEIISGFNKAGTEALKILEELVAYKLDDIRNVETVSKCIKTSISSKQYGYEDMLAPLIAQACIQVLPNNPSQFNVDNVRVSKILGGGVLDTQVVKGHVLNRGVEGTIKHVKNAKIAVLATGLESAKTETKDVLSITDAETLLKYSKSEEKAIETIINQIAQSGAKVVICGGAISEMALHFLERYKIMVIKVSSKFELRRLCRAVGATPLVRMGGPTPEELGHCDNVSVEEIGSTEVTIFRQERDDSGISTLVVRASTQNMLDDFERAIEDGVNVFKGLTKDPRLVIGGGATEIELAQKIQSFGESTPGLIQYAIKKYGESFEVVPRTLAENAGLNATTILSNLYSAHQKGQIHDGLNLEKGTISNLMESNVLDLLSTKQSAIRLATNTVVTILRIDQIIMSKPAGGPKPPKQGSLDTDD